MAAFSVCPFCCWLWVCLLSSCRHVMLLPVQRITETRVMISRSCSPCSRAALQLGLTLPPSRLLMTGMGIRVSASVCCCCVQAPAVMDSDTKKLIRAVVRRVHPDLFTAHPFERQRNSDSLKVQHEDSTATAQRFCFDGSTATYINLLNIGQSTARSSISSHSSRLQSLLAVAALPLGSCLV